MRGYVVFNASSAYVQRALPMHDVLYNKVADAVMVAKACGSPA
jgi:hypothetical protein